MDFLKTNWIESLKNRHGNTKTAWSLFIIFLTHDFGASYRRFRNGYLQNTYSLLILALYLNSMKYSNSFEIIISLAHTLLLSLYMRIIPIIHNSHPPHWMTFHQSSNNDVAVPTNPIMSSQSNPTKKEVVDMLGP